MGEFGTQAHKPSVVNPIVDKPSVVSAVRRDPNVVTGAPWPDLLSLRAALISMITWGYHLAACRARAIATVGVRSQGCSAPR